MASERPDLKSLVGQELTVIAWIWARTVKSPNPAFAEVDVPLASTFFLSTKAGKEAYVEPVIEGKGYRFVVRVGKPNHPEEIKNGTKLARGANFKCIMSGSPMAGDYIYDEGKADRMKSRLMAIVAEGATGRIYLPPTNDHEKILAKAAPTWIPDLEMPKNPRWFSPPAYGLTKYGDLFTPRQLVALNTFSDLVGEARSLIEKDAIQAGLPDDGIPLRDGGTGALAYAEAVGMYLGFAIDRMAMTGNTLVRWNSTGEKAQHCFGRHALPMLWDFSEVNFLGRATGSIDAAVFYSFDPLNLFQNSILGFAEQVDARIQLLSNEKIISTDPPYYDNIGYADLSDLFYVWLRRTLKNTFPKILATLSTPKADELVATPYRHGNKKSAEDFFLAGMTDAMRQLYKLANQSFPITIYYAFKQTEENDDFESVNTGWDTFLTAVIKSGLTINGTWPIRTEMKTRQIAMGTNALASSIVLVCRKRHSNLPLATKKEFIGSLNRELPVALRLLQEGNTAPVDMAQASIGPGMAIYTRYEKVMDAQGQPVSVREALALINEVLDKTLSEQEGDFDADTRFALAW